MKEIPVMSGKMLLCLCVVFFALFTSTSLAEDNLGFTVTEATGDPEIGIEIEHKNHGFGFPA